MNIAIVGYGIEGKAALTYWTAMGATITVCDQAATLELPEGVASQLGDNYLHDLSRFDLVFRSAGIPSEVLLADNPDIADKITTTMNEFFRVCPTKNILGITGTKGKGTTSTLTAKMLEAAGKQVFLGGNIGLSPLEFLAELTPESWVVLELSSFQLSDLHYSPHIGVCLMVVPEHLNWHRDMEDYVAAKSHLFAQQTPDDVAIYFAGSAESQQIASGGQGRKLPFFAAPGAEVIEGNITIDGQTICTTSELKLLGEHNWQNACAAVTAAWQVTQDVNAIRSVLTTFSGLPYHIEFIRELDGVKYYNDSFGTTPETAIVAIRAFHGPKVLILGGSDKGIPFDELAKTVASSNVRQVILIGNTTNSAHKTVSPKIEEALHAQGFDQITSLMKPDGPTMAEIVEAARAAAQPGDIVLLSTACASFDIFANYKERGRQFSAAVLALA